MNFVLLRVAPCDLSSFVCFGHARKLLLLRMHFAGLFFFAFLAPLPSAYMSHVFYLFSGWALVFLYSALCRYALMTPAIYALFSLYSATPKSSRVFLMLPCHATYMLFLCWVMYSLHLAIPKSSVWSSCIHDTCYLCVGLRCTPCTWQRPRVGVCSQCIHPCQCYLHAFYMLFCCWVLYSLHLATPKSRRVVLMLSSHALFIVEL